MIVINDLGFNDGRGLYRCVYGPHDDSTNVHGSHDGRCFHCRGRDGSALDDAAVNDTTL